jgi:FkbM family methyltransferase
MIGILSAYKNYSYKIPSRVKFFNLFRYPFQLPFLEKFLLHQISKGRKWWKKLVPPIYFYSNRSIRTAERNDLNYRLDISCLIDHSLYFYSLEEPTWDNLFRVVERDFVVMDIGANIGFHTLNFARLCSEGHVFAFEPDSLSFQILTTNIQNNDFKNITASSIALGAQPGKLPFYKIDVNNPGANRILDQPPAIHYGEDMVEVNTCDHFAEQFHLSKLDLLKIDVEGFELFVLQGASVVIKKYKPILFIELAEANLREHSLTPSILVEHIEKLGYGIKDARTMKPLDPYIKSIHTDIICFPAG